MDFYGDFKERNTRAVESISRLSFHASQLAICYHRGDLSTNTLSSYVAETFADPKKSQHDILMDIVFSFIQECNTDVE